MDIVQEFIKASLKETRNDMSTAYNSNLSKSERLAIILAKNLNGKILKKNRNSFSVIFNLSQDYNIKIYYSQGWEGSFSGHVYLKDEELFYWKNLWFFKGESQEYLTKTAKECSEKYNVPFEVLSEAMNFIAKSVSVIETFNNQNLPDDRPNDYRKSTRARKNLELYKKDQAYYKDLFIKSGALSEEDLAKYIISIKPEKCNDPDWDLDEDGGSATFDNQIAFTFRDRITKALYKLIYDVRFTAGANGWSSPGSYWEPPDGEEWLTGDVYDDVEADFNDIKTDEPLNEDLEEHLANIIDNFANSGMLAKYIEDNLEDVTGYDVR